MGLRKMKIRTLGVICGVIIGAIAGNVIIISISTVIATSGESPINIFGAAFACFLGVPVGAIVGGFIGGFLGSKLEEE